MAVASLLSSVRLPGQFEVPIDRTAASISLNDGTGQSSVSQSEPAFAKHLETAAARRVAPQRTAISSELARAAIERAYAELSGEPLDERAGVILTAHWAHETGHGSSMFNYNFGGLKGAGPSGLTVSQRTREGYGTTERRITDEFRAYNSIDEGAKDYVRLLLTRYGDAISAAKRGDASGFVQGLRARGYFTGDPQAYARSITSIAHRLASDDAGLNKANQVQAPLAEPSGDTGQFGGDWRKPHEVASTRGANRIVNTALLLAPQPTALFDSAVASFADAGQGGGFWDITSAHALAISDGLARTAIQIASEEATALRAEQSEHESRG